MDGGCTIGCIMWDAVCGAAAGRAKYTMMAMKAMNATMITVKEMFSMQNTPGGQRLVGMYVYVCVCVCMCMCVCEREMIKLYECTESYNLIRY